MIRIVFTGLLLLLPPSAVLHADEPAPAAETTHVLAWGLDETRDRFKRIEQFLPVRSVQRGTSVYPLKTALRDLGDTEYTVDGNTHTLNEYFETRRIAGLLVVHEGAIVYERYGLDNDESSRWISFSIAKSVTSMLLGAAIHEGFIKSVDDPVTDYLPQLRGSAYGRSTLRNVLQMSSGVAWNEDYADPQSDVSLAGGLNALSLYGHLNKLKVAAEPGEVFNYNTGETNLVGGIVRAAIGNNLATYLEQKIWQPFGMEADAYWNTDLQHRAELGGCCINATLRDYARIGLFAMNDGVLPDGKRVLPEGWIKQSTAPSKGYEGYGYLWWLIPDSPVYMALGIFGQMIWINPVTKTIIVTHSAWPQATNEEYSNHRGALAEALHAAVAGQ